MRVKFSTDFAKKIRGARLPAIDPFIPVCFLLALLLIQPLGAPGLPNTADGLLHLFRSALWRWAWDDGVLWPRWHTMLYQGYGYPLFNFYAPLLYIIASALSFLLPNILVAFKVTLFLACLNYSLGMYLWARDVLSREAAIVAAVAYSFATFRFRELYFQGNYAQFLAWSLYPWVLFFFRRLAAEPSRLHFVGAVLSLAALILTHNISVMLFGPVLLVYIIWISACLSRRAISSESGENTPKLLERGAVLIGAIICALALSAIFWLPALGEAKYTRVHVLTKGFFDVAEHFLRWRELLAPSPVLDYRATNPPMPFNFGRFHLLLVAAGALTIFKRSSNPLRRGHLVFALAGLLASAFMMLPISLPVWRSVPLIAFTEYPSRMYGVAFLFSSLLAGASVGWVSDFPRLRLPVTVLGGLGLILSVAVYQFPRPFLPLRVTPGDFVLYEEAFNVLGTTSASEYLNIWTSEVPELPAVRPDLSREALLDAAGVRAEVTEAKAHSLKLQVDASKPAEVAVAQFYFPGWRGWIDGTPVPLKPCEGSGLICLRIPAGEHRVALRFENTPIRQVAVLISLLGIAATLAVTSKLGSKVSLKVASPWRWRDGIALGVAVLGLLALKVLWVGPHTFWFRMYSPQGVALPAQHPTDVVVGNKVALLGYDIRPEAVRQGGELHVRLYWQALEPLDADYSSFVHLVAGPDNRFYAGSDSMHPAYIPTSTWNPSLYVVDDHYIRIPSDMPPIAFKLQVGLYERETMKGLGEAILPQWVNVLPRKPLRVAEIPHKLRARFGNSIELLGYGLDEEGGSINLTLYWQGRARITRDLQVFVHLVDAEGRLLSQADGPPVEGLYPTSKWWPGQIILDSHRISVPAGSHPKAILVGLYDLTTMQRLPAFREDGSEWEDYAVVIQGF
ncbi:MAG: hypothetical protein DRI61_01950 [Chloroflexi bacterium]|nr:MAG: hypothetical protein DRI61_01950 [Chloroflexota bacterium]